VKIMLIASSGGHLRQLFALKSWWQDYPRVWVTFERPDALALLQEEEVVWAYHPTNRNVLNLWRNTLLAIALLWRERPTLILSTGAGVALPFFFLGKFFGAKLIFMEVFDRVSSTSLTGRLLEPIVDKFLVQWPDQEDIYRRAEFWGSTIK
jgi:beta-1,4-N-acetylglucosaminyltransferase